MIKRIQIFVVLVSFFFNMGLPSVSFAQSSQTFLNLPVPGTLLSTSLAFTPALIKGLKIDPKNALGFNFIVDTGDTHLTGDALKQESNKMIKYFLAALTEPEKDLWVNLSPYEKDRIIAEGFGQTEMGRDMLGQDYVLKQLTASLIYPESQLGKTFWTRVYQKAREQFGSTNIPVNTFNKVWIVPDHAVIYEHNGTAFVIENKLKVMLDQDYLALSKNMTKSATNSNVNAVGSQVIREVLIPEIEKEVNTGKNFATLRQIANATVLAAWYKQALKESLLGKIYANKNKINGVDVQDKNVKMKIYNQYLQAFKKGVYNYIKEDYDPLTRTTVPRKYFSGGTVLDYNADGAMAVEDDNDLTVQHRLEIAQQMLSAHVFNVGGLYVEQANQAMVAGTDSFVVRIQKAALEKLERMNVNDPSDEAAIRNAILKADTVLPNAQRRYDAWMAIKKLGNNPQELMVQKNRISDQFLLGKVFSIRSRRLPYLREFWMRVAYQIDHIPNTNPAMLSVEEKHELDRWIAVDSRKENVPIPLVLEKIESIKPKYFIGGNWKMAISTRKQAQDLLTGITDKMKFLNTDGVTVMVAPSFVHIPLVSESLAPGKIIGVDYPFPDGSIRLGAQDVSYQSEKPGAYTSEVSAEQLRDLGVQYVIIGHSERRQKGETDQQVNAKVKRALATHLKVILAIGEKKHQREDRETENVLYRQMEEGLKGIPPDLMKNLVIAYEPVWAIGTGLTPTSEQINDTQRFIRAVLVELFDFNMEAARIPVLYGGSMNEKNAAEILKLRNVSGGLIGGASLDAEKFVPIVQAAVEAAKADRAMLTDTAIKNQAKALENLLKLKNEWALIAIQLANLHSHSLVKIYELMGKIEELKENPKELAKKADEIRSKQLTFKDALWPENSTATDGFWDRFVVEINQIAADAAMMADRAMDVKRPDIKRIGVLTGGGLATGHNSLITAALREAEAQGGDVKILGIPNGWAGLTNSDLKDQIRRLTVKEMERFENHGGSVIKSSRTNPVSVSKDEINKELIRLGNADPDAVPASVREETRLALVAEKVKTLIRTLKELHIDGLIVMGGDDTNGVSSIIHAFAPDFPILGVPKTMDNDVYLPGGAPTYGYDSFITAAANNLHNLMVSARDQDRVFVVETFGRDAGFTAIGAGARAGATLTLIPEHGKIDIDQVVEKVREFYIRNRYALVLVSEGVQFEQSKSAGGEADAFGHEKLEGADKALKEILSARLKDLKVTVTIPGKLDYAVREAPISLEDRMITQGLGQAAVRLLRDGVTGRILYTDSDYHVMQMSFPNEEGIVTYVDNGGVEREMNISKLRGDGPDVSADAKRKIGGRVAHVEKGEIDHDAYVAANQAIFGEQSLITRITLGLDRIQKEMAFGFDITNMSQLLNFSEELKRLEFDLQDLNPSYAKNGLIRRVSEIKDELSELIKVKALSIGFGQADSAMIIASVLTDAQKEQLRAYVSEIASPTKGFLAADGSKGTANEQIAQAMGLTPADFEAKFSEEQQYALRQDYRRITLTSAALPYTVGGVILYDEAVKYVDANGHNLVSDYVIGRGVHVVHKTDRGMDDDPDSPIPPEGIDTEKLAKPAGLGQENLNKILEVFPNSVATKFRITVSISDEETGLPTKQNILKMADQLAQHAYEAQVAGRVPTIEPEILIKGPHSINVSYQVALMVYEATFNALRKRGVYLPGVILKPSMVIAGNKAGSRVDPQEVAQKTVQALMNTVPEQLGAVLFLSGGQTTEEALANLNAIAKEAKAQHVPWRLSYSFSRAFKAPAMKIWAGQPENIPAAQKKFNQTLYRGQAASLGVLYEFDALMARVGIDWLLERQEAYNDMLVANAKSASLGDAVRSFDPAQASDAAMLGDVERKVIDAMLENLNKREPFDSERVEGKPAVVLWRGRVKDKNSFPTYEENPEFVEAHRILLTLVPFLDADQKMQVVYELKNKPFSDGEVEAVFGLVIYRDYPDYSATFSDDLSKLRKFKKTIRKYLEQILSNDGQRRKNQLAKASSDAAMLGKKETIRAIDVMLASLRSRVEPALVIVTERLYPEWMVALRQGRKGDESKNPLILQRVRSLAEIFLSTHPSYRTISLRFGRPSELNPSSRTRLFGMVDNTAFGHSREQNQESLKGLEINMINYLNSLKSRANLAMTAKADAAQVVKEDPLGGINLDPSLYNMQIRRDGNGIALPVDQQPIDRINISGIRPEIQSITPANLSLMLGIAQKARSSGQLAMSN